MNARLPTIIGLWQPVFTCVSRWVESVREFEHIGTVHAHPAADDFKSGQVVWGMPGGTSPVAICWDWAEVRVGVVALSNPMTVFSNVRLVAEDGAPLSHGQTILQLNGVIHELNWQRQVCEELSFRRRRTVAASAGLIRQDGRLTALRTRSLRTPGFRMAGAS